MNLLYPIIFPIAAGLLCFVIPRKLRYIHEVITLIFTSATFGYVIMLFTKKPITFNYHNTMLLSLDNLAAFIVLGVGFFGLIISVYSLAFMKNNNRRSSYYGSFLLTLGAAIGAILANHLIIFIVFWGFLGILLYTMILTGGEGSEHAATKSIIIVGGTDVLMILSIALIYRLTGTFEINKITISLSSIASYIAFLLISAGIFAKAGAMPFHTWVPDTAEHAPTPVTAFLPASLDKLIGIYFLARITMNVFQMNEAMKTVLMAIGSITIIAAVFMALIQHDFKRLLGYHAVSQVGYMVLGIGTGNPIGIAGGLFHMLNHAIYKSCLFLAGGSVEKQSGTTDLDKLGGLAKFMPLTYTSFLIAAFAISGIPPFNGFASKWLVYQGLIEIGQQGDKLWIIWLIAALFGSGLTLASFMKLTHAIFLGVVSPVNKKNIKESSALMTIPTLILALTCVIFGIFAFSIPLKLFVFPALGDVSILGLWSPGLATIMIFIGLGVGLIIYLFGSIHVREAKPFIGGETLKDEERVSGTGFYNTIRNLRIIKNIYDKALAFWFDIYEQLNNVLDRTAQFLRCAHTGVLSLYMVWLCIGLAILIFVLMGGSG